MEKHDVVVIGGGHNGLVAAAYLARAGLDVCVVEGRDICGGGVTTEVLTLPGFKHDPFSHVHSFIQVNPLISQDELKLKSKYGLRYIIYDPPMAFVFPDDRALVLYRDIDKTCESISQFSPRDAEAYRRFVDTVGKMNMKLGEISYPFAPPPTFGKMVSFLENSEEGQEYITTILGSSLDVVENWFESEQMQTVFLRWSCEIMTEPQQNGTGNWALGLTAIPLSWVFPEGGSGALTGALIACIKDNGGTIRVSSPVKAVKLEAGEAKGVVLDTGEEITATKATISSISVKQLFLEMLKSNEVPAGFQQKVRRIKYSGVSIMKQDIALNEAPRYKAGGDTNKAATVMMTSSKADLVRTLEELSHGIAQNRDVSATTVTLADPARAPEGKHVLYFWHLEPYHLKDGASKWDEIKQEVADAALETLRKHTTNMGPENILGRFIRTPLDFERCNPAWIAGDANHIGMLISQLYGNRPLPGWSNYRTPVKKLYMCGPSTHPGPAVSGGSRAAMPVIMEDLGIDFKKVIAK